MRYTVKQVKLGWIVYDERLMRPVGMVYETQCAAKALADKFNK